MTHRSRLLLVGIDSATLDLIQPWAERGELPAMGRLMKAGAFGRLRSVPNMMTPGAWTSFATGYNPGKHGIFWFTERVPGSYEERLMRGSARAGTPFWTLLSQAGITCTVVDVPMTFPADRVNGVMISGMDAPSPEAPGFTHPPDLAVELQHRFNTLFGATSIYEVIGDLVLARRLDTVREILEQRVAVRTELARHLMDRYPADFFCIVHMEVDIIQHYFWKFTEPQIPRDTRQARRHGDSILRLYQELDESIETMIEAFGPANVMIMSDHGAGVSPGGQDGLPWIRAVLEEMGLSVRQGADGGLQRISRAAVGSFYRAVGQRLSRAAKRRIAEWAPTARRALAATVLYHQDWSRTRAFCLGAPGEVWLNVRGRDPQGLVEPGAEYDRIRRQIRETFMALRDAQTGEPIIEAVHFREEIYNGPFVEQAPDVLILFRDVVVNGIPVNGKVLKLPPPTIAVPRDIKSGSHRPQGVVMLSGAGVKQGAELKDANLLDIAPTVMYLMGQPVSRSMDGQVLAQAFTPDHLLANPVKMTDASTGTPGPADPGYTSDEATVIMERLRGLGYVD